MFSKENLPLLPHIPLRTILPLGLTMEMLPSSPCHADVPMAAWDLKHLFPEAEVEMWNGIILCYVGFSCLMFCEEIQDSVHHSSVQGCMLHARKSSGDVSTRSVSVRNNKQEQLSSESSASPGSSWELDLLFWLESMQLHIPEHLQGMADVDSTLFMFL